MSKSIPCVCEGIVDETCSVELVNSVVVGNSATITFRGVGSEITGFICKLDGSNLPECMFLISWYMYSYVSSHAWCRSSYMQLFCLRFMILSTGVLLIMSSLLPMYHHFSLLFLLPPTSTEHFNQVLVHWVSQDWLQDCIEWELCRWVVQIIEEALSVLLSELDSRVLCM